ncbi:imine reductase family protein [Rhodococcus sp. 114MFTsu3.1]|uniref:imine reductase family protein n=1 Tax=Rhodococcus sp. 114MFTsu3.1 TaxID=1172184 RepID=UPI00037B15AD|nr:NAD(P)-binding domain-containing protein [Rhodococcus sp. 114MFTsu3.1]
MTKSTAILGLGAMGEAITRAAAAKGHHLRAWNRTPRTIDGIDVEMSATVEDSTRNADIVVVCVRNHEISRTVIDRIPATNTSGVLINFSTGTPTDTVDSAALAAARGVRYVTGAMMVPTSMVGTEHCSALYAGAEEDFTAAQPILDALGGSSDIVGNDHSTPPALDLAMLDIYFSGMYAYLHAAALAAAHGVEPAAFLPYARGIVDTLGGSLPASTTSLRHRRYDQGDARLDMCLSFLTHIVESSHQAGIDPGLAEHVRAASARALDHWPAATDWDVVAEKFLGESRSRPRMADTGQ